MENKKNSIQMSESELQKAIDQIPQEYVQEAMAHIPEEDIEKISQMKEINIQNLEKLSAGLSHETKNFLKFLGAGAAIISIGTGGYLIGQAVGRKNGYSSGINDGYSSGINDGYKLGYKKGKHYGSIAGFHHGHEKAMLKMAKEPNSVLAMTAMIAWFSGAGAGAKLHAQDRGPDLILYHQPEN